jgi:choline dehydrogenase-like flavoprotein
MGDDPADSVIDRNMVHHRVRNLLVMGSGAFPTGAPANPTLTISALALRAAAHQHGQGGRPA